MRGFETIPLSCTSAVSASLNNVPRCYEDIKSNIHKCLHKIVYPKGVRASVVMIGVKIDLKPGLLFFYALHS